MTPSKLDITIWRGTSYELELISQVKNYNYDPAIHNTPADLRRTHAENLEEHGWVYEYIDFLSLYAAAELIINKPWVKAGETSTPLKTYSLAAGDLTLTSTSTQIGITPAATKLLDFNEGSYELLLTTASGKIDGLVYGSVTVLGEM